LSKNILVGHKELIPIVELPIKLTFDNVYFDLNSLFCRNSYVYEYFWMKVSSLDLKLTKTICL